MSACRPAVGAYVLSCHSAPLTMVFIGVTDRPQEVEGFATSPRAERLSDLSVGALRPSHVTPGRPRVTKGRVRLRDR